MSHYKKLTKEEFSDFILNMIIERFTVNQERSNFMTFLAVSYAEASMKERQEREKDIQEQEKLRIIEDQIQKKGLSLICKPILSRHKSSVSSTETELHICCMYYLRQ